MTYEEKLFDLSQLDDRIVVMTAENRAAIRTLPGKIGPRFIDVGICEQTMVGAAAGMALRGKIPVVHALAAFLTLRAFEFIRTDIGYGQLPVKLVGGVPGFFSEANGPTHQAVEDVSVMRGIPAVKIFCPADREELVAGLPQIIADPSPWYIRYTDAEPIVKHYDQFVIGKAEILSEGMDVALVTYGLMVKESWRAKEILESKGISTRLINLRTLKPIDDGSIIGAIKECSLVVTIEDHFLTGGLYSIVSEIAVKHSLRASVLPIALDNQWFTPALLHDVLAYEGFTGEQISARIVMALTSTQRNPESAEEHRIDSIL